MKKIMFNDRYCLTQAVIEGRKTMTRRGDGINPYLTDVYDNSVDRFNRGHIDYIELLGTKRVWAYKPRYKVGEIVAVAQSYETVFYDEHGALPTDTDPQCNGVGFKNKMFVKAEYMPHQIRITGVRAERLQDISDEDCLKEGIVAYTKDNILFKYGFNDIPRTWFEMPRNPREAFSILIDKVSGKGTWNRNPWVWVYEFELVK